VILGINTDTAIWFLFLKYDKNLCYMYALNILCKVITKQIL